MVSGGRQIKVSCSEHRPANALAHMFCLWDPAAASVAALQRGPSLAPEPTDDNARAPAGMG